MNLLKLKKLANSGHFDDLAQIWPEALADDDTDRDELLRIVAQVRRLGADEHADKLLSSLLSLHEEEGGKRARLDACRDAAVVMPRSEMVRKELRTLYNTVHKDNEQVSELTGRLLADGEALDKAVPTLDRFLQLTPGRFFTDRGHLEPGMVLTVDGGRARLDVTFGGRSATLDRAAVDAVIILPEDHFPSMLLYKQEELKAMADQDPEAFVLSAVRATRDRMCSYKDLRKHHAALLGEDAWAKWWKTARPVLKASSKLELSGASQPTFRMLRRERTYEQRLREQFATLKEVGDKLRFVLDYLDETRKDRTADPALLADLGNTAAKLAAPLLTTDPSMTLACLAVHARVARRDVPVAKLNPQAAASVVDRIQDPAQLPNHLGDQLLSAVLHFVREVRPDAWADFWSRVLPRCGRLMSEMLVRELLAADHVAELTRALHQVLDHPTASPDVLGWLWRARHADTKQAVVLRDLPGVSTAACFEAMLQLADATGRMSAVSDDKRLRRILDQTLDTLALYDCKPIQEYVDALDMAGSRRLKESLESNGGLRASLKATVAAMIRNRHPEVFVEAAKPWQEDAHYSTERGLQLRRAELEHLVTEELPAVAKQIGEAASHGDLSENSEYTAALEKRDQVTSNATRIENELAKAKVITKEMASTDFVNVGTRVRLRDLMTGKEETLTFLGAWDSNPAKGILSYQAPLAMAFMGQVVGDQVEFGEEGHKRRWEILGVESAL
ncbi:MAG TPA: GreA/GreB family elongation factor [Candidatus Krumholzibacteria bacterium]|nr:GreA/GreB family elongation factor [Candidatus Krumholzibacteria bacterium]